MEIHPQLLHYITMSRLLPDFLRKNYCSEELASLLSKGKMPIRSQKNQRFPALRRRHPRPRFAHSRCDSPSPRRDCCSIPRCSRSRRRIYLSTRSSYRLRISRSRSCNLLCRVLCWERSVLCLVAESFSFNAFSSCRRPSSSSAICPT